MKKSFYSYFLFLFLVVFFSCDKIPDLEVIDPEPEGDAAPTTILNTNQTFFNQSSVNVAWVGNEYAISFQYKATPLSYDSLGYNFLGSYADWSTWNTDTDVQLNNLDDGFYTFYVQSRYTSDLQEETPKNFTFQVDAVSGTSLRIYPLYQQVGKNSNCDFYIYADNVTDLAGMEIHLTYDSQLFTFDDAIMPGNSSLPIFITEHDIETSNITIIATVGEFDAISGTKVLAKITLQSKQVPLSAPISILDSSQLRNSGGNIIEITNRVSGQIEVID